MLVGKIKYILVMIIIFITPGIVQAECSYERTAELSRIASNVQFSYDYDDDLNFNVTISNLTNDIYITDDSMNFFSGTGEKNMNYINGTSISYSIFSNDPSCKDEKLLTKYVNLPSYNYYYSSDECQRYPNFKYCTLWGATDIDVEQFESELAKYINSEDVVNNEVKKNNLWLDFLEDNKVQIIVCLIGIIVIALIFVVRRIRKK